MFKVHIGYTRKGRDRWRRFETMAEAIAFCQRIFAATSVVLSIVKV